jgi:hypothetical protein
MRDSLGAAGGSENVKILFLLLAVATPVAAQVPASSQDTARARAVAAGAVAVGARPLTDTSWFRSDLRAAALAVAADLRLLRDDPNEFYVTLEPRAFGTVVIFHLWHRSAFYPENAQFDGNPGGKCLDVWYDLERQAITRRLVWQ